MNAKMVRCEGSDGLLNIHSEDETCAVCIVKVKGKKLKAYRCPKCGGDEVGHDAASIWDEVEQEWTLGSTYDDGWCSECGEVEPEKIKLEGDTLMYVLKCQRVRAIRNLGADYADALAAAMEDGVEAEKLAAQTAAFNVKLKLILQEFRGAK